MAPPIRTRPSFPLSQFLLSGSFHKPLILLHQRADSLKTTVTEKYSVKEYLKKNVYIYICIIESFCYITGINNNVHQLYFNRNKKKC